MTNPFGATATVVVGVGMVSVGAILGAEKINELYEACDAEQRRALTDVLAYGARKLWLIRKLLRLAVR